MIQKYPAVLALWLSMICTVASAAPAAQSDPAISEMDRILTAAFRPDAPGAAVLVVRHGQVLLRKGYGMADLELGVPVDPAQVFHLCSITKQFTAVAILQLVEAGKVRLDDSITTYLPDYPADRKNVTLENLLANTSGIPGVTTLAEWSQIWRQDMTVAQLVNLTKNKPLDFSPGTDWKYSNSGFVLLGAVIEKVSGQSYADYVQTHIFAPADMTHSYYGNQSPVIHGRVPGYSRDGNAWINAPFISMTQPYAAGSLLSSVDDMWKWEQALQSGKLISPAMLARAYTEVHLPDGRGTSYGLGWQLGTLGNHPTIEHAGGMPGFSNYEIHVTDADVYVVILCNTEDAPVPTHTLAVRLARLALGESDPTASPATISQLDLQDYVGDYRVGPDSKFTVMIKNGKLMGQLGHGKRPLIAIATDEFDTSDVEMDFKFMRDMAHHVDRVAVRSDGPGPVMIWPRIDGPSN